MLLNGIENVHLEPTARCNAGCPMCSRTGNSYILNNQGEINYEQFRQIFPPSFIKGLKKFKFCGNYGDPAAAKDLLKFHEYIYAYNPTIEFILSTNGGLRTPKFWEQLAAYYLPHSHVQFHIDGLEDTNEIYRVGVRWDKLMENVKAFNNAGGTSKWFWIPFFHNEHQIEKGEKLSNEIGCKEFVIKVSARFRDGSQPFVYDNGTKRIYPPVSDRFRFEKFQTDGKLQCVSELRKEIYVDAWAKLWPCCWTASASRVNPQWVIDNDLTKRSIEEIMSDPVTDEWVNKLYSKSGSVCNRRCTGKYIHIIDRQGKQVPQKDYWLEE